MSCNIIIRSTQLLVNVSVGWAAQIFDNVHSDAFILGQKNRAAEAALQSRFRLSIIPYRGRGRRDGTSPPSVPATHVIRGIAAAARHREVRAFHFVAVLEFLDCVFHVFYSSINDNFVFPDAAAIKDSHAIIIRSVFYSVNARRRFLCADPEQQFFKNNNGLPAQPFVMCQLP